MIDIKLKDLGLKFTSIDQPGLIAIGMACARAGSYPTLAPVTFLEAISWIEETRPLLLEAGASASQLTALMNTERGGNVQTLIRAEWRGVLDRLAGPGPLDLIRAAWGDAQVIELYGPLKTAVERRKQARRRALRGGPPPIVQTGICEAYGDDLVKLAPDMDPIIGRDYEITRAANILARRAKNSVVLLGQPGVGKSAVMVGLAQRIARGDVPTRLRNRRIILIDLGRLTAGAMFPGMVARRLDEIGGEVADSNGHIILVFDDVHNYLGGGAGNLGQSRESFADEIKRFLEFGAIRFVGTTSPKDWRAVIGREPGLERRIQTLEIDEPDRDATVSILRGLREGFERMRQSTPRLIFRRATWRIGSCQTRR
jgi:hypothetical protein